MGISLNRRIADVPVLAHAQLAAFLSANIVIALLAALRQADAEYGVSS